MLVLALIVAIAFRSYSLPGRHCQTASSDGSFRNLDCLCIGPSLCRESLGSSCSPATQAHSGTPSSGDGNVRKKVEQS